MPYFNAQGKITFLQHLQKPFEAGNLSKQELQYFDFWNEVWLLVVNNSIKGVITIAKAILQINLYLV